MNHPYMVPGAALAAVLLLSTGGARAHQIWIEPTGKQVKVYFGEFGENLREASPGYLDKFVSLEAKVVAGDKARPVPLAKEKDGYAAAVRLRKGESLLAVEPGYPPFEKKEGGKSARSVWTPAARYIAGFEAQKPALILDVVPTGKPGEFQVVYRDQPLAKAEVSLVAASGWSREARADEQGKVRFDLPWKGDYVVLVRHEDEKPGKRVGSKGEESFDAASFATTLSFRTRTGMAPAPRPKPAPPNVPEE